MTDSTANSVLAWLLTYAIHSTALLGLAWVVSRRAAMTSATRDFTWKVALVGGIATSAIQAQLAVRPAGTLALTPAPVAAVSTDARSSDADLESRDRTLNPSASPGVSANENPAAGSATPASTDASSSGRRVRAGLWILTAWGAAALALALGYLARRLILVGRIGDRRPVSDGALPAMLDALRASAGYEGSVRLTSSATISSPVALGLGEICVPEAALTDLDTEQQRGLLAHELAHLARRDPVWLDAASLIERVFFFQPLNRLARREMQQAAEYLCDDWAAARTGSGVPLARCLARVAEWIQASPLGVPVAGMAEQRSQLVSRISRLLEGRAVSAAAPRFALGGTALVLLSAMVAAAPGVQGTAVVRPGPAPSSPAPAIREPQGGAPSGVVPAAGAPTGRAPHGSAPVLAGGSAEPGEEEQDTTIVNALIERLRDSDAGVRRAAASSLGNLHARRAVTALIAALRDQDREVRSEVASALGNIGDDRALGPLTDLIDDPSPDVREHVLDALGNFEKDVPAAPVINALHDTRASVREKAAHLLGHIGDRAATQPLTRVLRDQMPAVREAALRALAEIKDPAAAAAVTGALRDEHPDVRHAALDALHEMKAPIAERTILDALEDPSPDVRTAGIQIVSDRPFPQAVPALRKLLDDPSADVRVEAVSALGEIGDPAAREALRAALKSADAKVRKRAAEVLGERR